MAHQMLPVFIVEETSNLFESLARNLRGMLGEDELPDDLLRGLLGKQRIMIVVDALSEREPPTQRHIETLYDQGWPVNALVITSRRDPDLKAVDRTSLRPEPYRGTADSLHFRVSPAQETGKGLLRAPTSDGSDSSRA